MLGVFMLTVFMLSVIMLSVIVRIDVMLKAIMLTVVAPFQWPFQAIQANSVAKRTAKTQRLNDPLHTIFNV
jgi:hypothetical protein